MRTAYALAILGVLPTSWGCSLSTDTDLADPSWVTGGVSTPAPADVSTDVPGSDRPQNDAPRTDPLVVIPPTPDDPPVVITPALDCDEVRTSLTDGLVWVEAREPFMMGAVEGDLCDTEGDEARHEVTLTRSFCMQATEVTQAAFFCLLDEAPSDQQPGTAYCNEYAAWGTCCDPWTPRASCPVDNINFYMALAYANALSEQLDLPPCYDLEACTGTLGDADYVCPDDGLINTSYTTPYDCEGFRLPTEAEWEYAIRAGADGEVLYNGSQCLSCNPTADAGDIAWSARNAAGQNYPVASKGPNDWGLYDMAGNVQEWVWDFYAPHTEDALEDPLVEEARRLCQPGDQPCNLIRGGHSDSTCEELRSSARMEDVRQLLDKHTGFRLVRTVSGGSCLDSDG